MLVRADFSVDGAPLRPLVSKDGILDSKVEQFELTLPEVSQGNHVATVRVEDEAGNVGTGEVRF